MSGHAGAEVVGAIGIFMLLTSVITVTIWQFGATLRAKALLSREEVYRTLAERAVLTQENTERRLTEHGERLADLRSRMDSLERILKEVE